MPILISFILKNDLDENLRPTLKIGRLFWAVFIWKEALDQSHPTTVKTTAGLVGVKLWWDNKNSLQRNIVLCLLFAWSHPLPCLVLLEGCSTSSDCGCKEVLFSMLVTEEVQTEGLSVVGI